jgi:predicted MPP superfamily phosphohydrolase
MVEFNWLHLTDLHWGMKGFEDRWWNVEQDFFNDLTNLINNAELGSLDLVLFTGDLVYSGRSEEFQAVDRDLLPRLWDKFNEMDFNPKLLAVPGNHDLLRPEKSSTLLNLVYLWNNDLVRKPFWEDRESAERKVVEEAFANYANWWQGTTLKPEKVHDGILPGDFSTTIAKEGYRLGIVGLNSSFRQLTADDYGGKLVLDNRQFNSASDVGSGPRWVQDHELSLLLTHHPPYWMTKESQEQLDGEIYRPGRFALHLFGHMHEPDLRSVAVYGAEPRNRLQGCSMFAMDGWGEESRERTHGYSLGQLKIEEGKAHMRFWPRKAVKLGAEWNLGADNIHFKLPDDRATKQVIVKETILPRKPPASNGSYTLPAVVPMVLKPEVADPLLTEALDASQQGTTYPALSTRLDALEQSLERAKQPPSAWRLKMRLREEEIPGEDLWGADSPIDTELALLRAIRTNLEKAEGTDANAGRFIMGAWRSYARVSERSQEIFREWLDVAGGLTLRTHELDERLFRMADRLIEDCAAGSGVPSYVSIPAAQENLAKTMGHVIRLRFPEWTIWNVPFAVHEYGQVVVDHVDALRTLVEDTTTSWVNQDREWQLIAGNEEEKDEKQLNYQHQLRKFVADAFATHTLGPAYACAAILLHFDPLFAYDERAAYDKRARVMLAMLEKMDNRAGGSPYEKMVELLEHHWKSVLGRAKPSGSTEATDEERLRDLVDEIWERIYGEYRNEKLYPPAGGESGWQIAKGWAANWIQQLEANEPLSVWEVSSGSKLRDVLNAAWLCRISYPEKIEQITGAADDQCEAIIAYATEGASGSRVRHKASSQRPSKHV